MATKKKAKKKAKKATKKTGRKVGSTPEEVETWLFCSHKQVRYVASNMKRTAFNSALVGALRFHKQNLGNEALLTEIEIFSTRLDNYLLNLGYAARQRARADVANAVRDKAKPMSTLLDAVAENYKS